MSVESSEQIGCWGGAEVRLPKLRLAGCVVFAVVAASCVSRNPTAVTPSPDASTALFDGGSDMDGGDVTDGGHVSDAGVSTVPTDEVCAGSTANCGMMCVDINADLENCGGCGLACTSGQVCNRGTCQILPTDCTTQGASCGPGYFCEPTTRVCVAGCRLQADCPQGGTCSGGRCECGAGQHACGQTCVSNLDVNSCGTSCRVCPGAPNGQATCDGMACGIACEPGFFAKDGACNRWTTCQPGSFIETPGTATSDAECSPCAAGSFSDTANASACTACAAGTFVGTAGSVSCMAWPTSCQSGSFVQVPGTATSDQVCAPCGVGQFSAASNGPTCSACPAGTFASTSGTSSCSLWTACRPGEVLLATGSATRDAVCVRGRQFGTDGFDTGKAIAVDASGNVYLGGSTGGALPGQNRSGAPTDAFVQKYDSAGTLMWTRQFGASLGTSIRDIAVDVNGNVVVAGLTEGTLPGQPNAGSLDALVRKYDSSGIVVWTRQFGSLGSDYANSVAVDSLGTVLVGGVVSVPTQSGISRQAGFVRKFDSSGAVLWVRQITTAEGEAVTSIAVDGSGNVLAAGFTSGALSGQINAGVDDGFIVKYDSNGAELWTRQFGTSGYDFAHGLAVDALGNAFVTGSTFSALPGQVSSGGLSDAYIRKYDPSGTALWTRQFGTRERDLAISAAVDASGNVIVAGDTEGAFPGQTSAGRSDGFVTKYDSSGAFVWLRQFGSNGFDSTSGIAVDASGQVLVVGSVEGVLSGQIGAGGQDAFYLRLLP
jgi:hypothetical protein